MMKSIKTSLLSHLIVLLKKEVLSHHPDNPSRRKFISQTAKGTTAIAISLSLPQFLSSCKENKPAHVRTDDKDPGILDVAILGGGMAGLNCANHLLTSGLNFKIFEADRRVGGRILTHYNDVIGLGVYPEFGGDFIDSGHSDMIALAKEFNLELVDLIQEQEINKWQKDIYYFDNRKISEKEIIKSFKKIAPQIGKDMVSLGENYDTPEAIKLDNTPLSDYINAMKCPKWMKELLSSAFIAEYGLDCQEQSTINMLDLIDINTDGGFKVFGSSDERFRIKGGNSKIIEGLVKKIGNDKIAKNYEVQSISEQEDGTYLISFKNNEIVLSHTVVCTIPFNILRNIELSLKNMTPEKQKCIDDLGYGKNTKLVLGYDGQPWRNKPNNAMGYLFSRDMTNGWDGSVNKTTDSKNGVFVTYFGGAFSQNLSNVSSKNPMAPPTHVWRTQLPDEKINGFVDELDKIFPTSKKKFLNKHIFVNWLEYPFVKASYSCYKPGQWTSIAGLEIQPVDRCYFAGEHCSTMFQGFMNGAAESGRIVALQLIEANVKKLQSN